MKRIRFVLQGGLGNQMFIWAASQHCLGKLGEGNHVELVTSGLQHAGTPRELGLNSFNISNSIRYSEFSSGKLLFMRIIRKIFAPRNTNKPLMCGFHISRTTGFDQVLEDNLGKVKIATGYFQSFKYVSDGFVSRQLESLDLTSPGSDYLRLLAELRSEPSIVMHVRRGDYMNFSDEFGVLSTEYFRNAITLIPLWEGFKLWIFSDDEKFHDELRTNFPSARLVFKSNELSPAEVLLLMSSADNIVTSNSSFSWWAGYLMKLRSADSFVVAPNPWSKTHTETGDLIPGNWLNSKSIWMDFKK